MVFSKRRMIGNDAVTVRRHGWHGRFIFWPGPSIGEPELGNDVESSSFGSTVVRCNANIYVTGILFILGVLNKNIPIAVVVKSISVQNLKLVNIPTSVLVLAYKLVVRECLLRILVQEFHVRVGGRGIEIPIKFLDVFTMISLVARYAEQTFFQNVVLTVPEGQGEAKALMIVRYSGDSILTPSISA